MLDIPDAAARSVDAVVFDYGGVLTTALPPVTARWLSADNIDPASFHSTMRRWLGRDAARDNPVHLLETGRLALSEFEHRLAAALVTLDGAPVRAEGLVDRLFAGMRHDPVMVDLLRTARAAGLHTALLSNSWGNDYPRALLDELCDIVVISGEIGLRKPDPAIYRHLLNQLGLPPGRCVFVDDFPVNVRGAEAVGMRAIHHVNPVTTRTALHELIVGGARP